MSHLPRLIVYSVLGLLLGAVGGLYGSYRAALDVELTHWDTLAPGRLFSGSPPLPLPGLQALVGDAATDADGLARVAAYVTANTDELRAVFRETDTVRAQAFAVMHLAHTSHVYGSHAPDAGFLDWLANPLADCGSYAQYQAQMLSALGLNWRRAELSGGMHQWIEVDIGGRWELFDATTNVWSNISAERMLAGETRTVRSFWTPAGSADAVPRYPAGMLRAVLDLRANLPLLGVGWYPKSVVTVVEVSQ